MKKYTTIQQLKQEQDDDLQSLRTGFDDSGVRAFIEILQYSSELSNNWPILSDDQAIKSKDHGRSIC